MVLLFYHGENGLEAMFCCVRCSKGHGAWRDFVCISMGVIWPVMDNRLLMLAVVFAVLPLAVILIVAHGASCYVAYVAMASEQMYTAGSCARHCPLWNEQQTAVLCVYCAIVFSVGFLSGANEWLVKVRTCVHVCECTCVCLCWSEWSCVHASETYLQRPYTCSFD